MTTQDLAISHAQECRKAEDPVKMVLDCAYISLALLYEELARAKQIPSLMELDKKEKVRLWKLTYGSRIKRIWQCQALYVYELLNK